MSEARTIWHELELQRSSAASNHRTGVAIAALLLLMMAASEVLFLRYAAGADSVNLISAAEGIPVSP